MRTAIEVKYGVFEVRNSAGLTTAKIVRGELGWRVMSMGTGRKNSRTFSDSPEQAASKYYNGSVQFEYLPCTCLVAHPSGRASECNTCNALRELNARGQR